MAWTRPPIEVEIEYAGQIVKAAMTNKSLYTNVSIKKTGYVEVMPGQTLRYDFTDRQLHHIPRVPYWSGAPACAAHLQKIVTGTWNVPGSRDAQATPAEISTGSWRTISAPSRTMCWMPRQRPWASPPGRRQRSSWYSGIVPANFRQVEAPVVYCTASQWLTGGSQIVNQTDVAVVHDGQGIMGYLPVGDQGL